MGSSRLIRVQGGIACLCVVLSLSCDIEVFAVDGWTSKDCFFAASSLAEDPCYDSKWVLGYPLRDQRLATSSSSALYANRKLSGLRNPDEHSRTSDVP